MTLVSEIIQRAYRESTLIPLGATPNAAQISEALAELNTLVSSVFGNEVGDPYFDLLIGGTYDQTYTCQPWIPQDVRLVCNLPSATTLNLDPNPVNGQRLAVIDVSGNFATRNLTLAGSQHHIEGATSLVLSTNSTNREWFYRADLGNWQKISSLVSGDTFPFPDSFNIYFQCVLAMRLNPRYGQSITPETAQMLKLQESNLRSEYNKPKQVPPELVSRRWLTTQGRWFQGFGGSPNFFNQGSVWPWR